MQTAKRVTLSRVPSIVEKLLHATSADARKSANRIVGQIMAQLYAAVEKRLLGPATDTLVRSAAFLDPVQFRATFKRDATGKFDKETLCEVNKCIMGVLHLVDSVFARQCSSTTGSSQQDDDNITGLIAEEMDGWGAKKLHGKLQEYRKTDKNDATDPLDWWRAHAKGLEPLDMVARWLLCIPATLAESERTFSLAGRLVSPLRTRLAGDSVHELTLLASQLRRSAARSDSDRSFARLGLSSSGQSASDGQDGDDDGQPLLDDDEEMVETLDEACKSLQEDSEPMYYELEESGRSALPSSRATPSNAERKD
jgi:hypothetical protein